MQVKRNFDLVYSESEDPWNIGNADSDRYRFYRSIITKHMGNAISILDIGCGFGAFLSHFKADCRCLVGVELAKTAITKGKERFPFIDFYQGSAAKIEEIAPVHSKHFDIIIYSDCIYYLNETEKQASLKWIAEHLSENGMAFIAAWCPGEKYLTFEELENIIAKKFGIIEQGLLTSNHAWFMCRRSQCLVALTFDYETWHPIPEGKKIDWEADIFRPAERLMEVADKNKAILTFFVEMGEYLYLKEYQPQIAQCMAEQLCDAVKRGHDVQLHLHLSWLPELGANHINDEWYWNWQYKRIHDYPGDLTELLGQLKQELESIIRPVKPDYGVTCFRSGAYAAQPFYRLAEALVANGIMCDSSVYAYGVSAERGYDYSTPYSIHQPYFANTFDPQLKAPPAETSIVELPVAVIDGKRIILDGSEAGLLVKHSFDILNNARPTSNRIRFVAKMRKLYNRIYYKIFRLFPNINKIVPEKLAWWACPGYLTERQVLDNYFVLIGHTKSMSEIDTMDNVLSTLNKEEVTFISLSDMARTAQKDLLSRQFLCREDEMKRQVSREFSSVMGQERHTKQSYHLQKMIPLDRKLILDLGCGAGYWSAAIATLYPWMQVEGVDAGEAFIAKANKEFGSGNVSFTVADFSSLPRNNGHFDAVYADNVLEHAFDVRATLSETYRVLREGGCLVAAVPPDGFNPTRSCDNHTWKTTPDEFKRRLKAVGFVDVQLHMVNTRLDFLQQTFPPSKDMMMYAIAWKRLNPISQVGRAIEIMSFIYNNIEPEYSAHIQTTSEILKNGKGICSDYSIVLYDALCHEGFNSSIINFYMSGHPKGRGKKLWDTHALVEAELDGKMMVLDPTVNLLIPYSFATLIKNPELVDDSLKRVVFDKRFQERQYDLYCSTWAYEHCYHYTNSKSLESKMPIWLQRVLADIKYYFKTSK